jgi:uncharacterized membrane protein
MLPWVIVLGIATGMRTMTPMAVLCWAMWFAMMPVTGWTYWTANVVSVAIFTLLAIGEYVGDTLPQTPNRTSVFPFMARIGFGALVGSLAAAAMDQPIVGGIIFALIGVLIGAYGGFHARMALARRVGNDFPVAVGESALALLLSVASMHGIIKEIARAQREVMLILR